MPWQPPSYATPVLEYEPNKPVPNKLPPVMGLSNFINSITDPTRRQFIESALSRQRIPQIPDYATPIPESNLRKTWNTLNTPLVSPAGSGSMGPMVERFSEEHPYARLAIDTATGLTSPLSLGLGAMTGGATAVNALAGASENFAQKQALVRIAKMLETPGRVAAGGMVGQGLYNLGTGENLPTKLGGGIEAGLGALGMRSLTRPVPKMEVLPAIDVPNQRLALPPPRSLVFPEGANQPYLTGPQPIRLGPSSLKGDEMHSRGILSKEPLSDLLDLKGQTTMTGERVREFFGVEPKEALQRGWVIREENGQYRNIQNRTNDASYSKIEKPILDAEGRSLVDEPYLEQNRLPERPEGPWNQNIDNRLKPTGARKLSEWRPPDYAEPIGAKTEGGIKIGADVKSLGRVLGSSLYKGDISKIVTKELMQNSLDAVRHLGPEGKVDVKFDQFDANSSITVIDNGKGLTKQELETVFTDLGSSGKRSDENAIGGFGLAKAAPLLGGDRVKVSTVVKEADGYYEHSFEGTPEELLEGVEIKSEKINPEYIQTNGKSFIEEPQTGTTITTYVPKNSEFWTAKEFVKKLLGGSSNIQGQISVSDRQWNKNFSNPEIYKPSDLLEGADIKTLEHELADVDIVIPKGTEYGPSAGVPYSISNQGMYQSSGHYGGWNELPGIPKKILVNIRSKVSEGHKDYPFTANREELRGPINELLGKYIKENIVNPSIGRRMQELSQVYNNMPVIRTNNGKNFHFYDVGNKFTPEELNSIMKDPIVTRLASNISNVLHSALSSQGNPKWSEKLEKVGFIFDEKLKGIHIPNPGVEKSAILINPFSIMSNRTPDGASIGIMHTILHELAHVEGGGHDENFTIRMSEIHEKYGAQNVINAQQEFLRSIADRSGNYHPAIQEVLHRYTNARGRKGSETDPLYGTGIGSRNKKSDRKNEVPLNSRPDATRAITKLKSVLQEAVDLRAEQEAIYTEERGKRIKAASSVKKQGEAGFYQQLGKLKGKYEKVEGPNIRAQLGQADIDTLFDTITNSSLDKWAQINAKTGLAKLLGEYGNHVPQQSELKLLAQVFGNDIVELAGGLGVINPGNTKQALHIVNETANVMKSLMASVDFSAPLRQGLPLIYRKEYWNAFQDMFKAWDSEEAFKASQQALEERPKFNLGKAVGLKLTEVGEDLTKREEAFIGSWAERMSIPGIPGRLDPLSGHSGLVRKSNRAYVAFLNHVRAGVFDNLVDDAKALGLNEEEIAPNIAKFVNTASGRGDLGRLEKAAVELNTVLFSPRLISSRLTMLNPNYYVKLDPFTRKQALTALFSVAAAGTLVTGLSTLAGGTTEYDPTSSDFMKAKLGNTRLDVYGGFQQYIVAANKLIKGLATGTDVTTGLKQFGENRLSPMLSFVNAILKGNRGFAPSGLGGAITNNRPGAELINRFIPLILGDLIDMYQDNPNLLRLGVLGGMGAFGAGLQTYEGNPNKNKVLAPRKLVAPKL